VGAFRIEPGSKDTPREFVRSQLLYHDDLYTPDGPISEEIVALRRDLNERKFLVELVQQEKKPTIGLTDGPLELFRAPSDRKLYDRYLDDYIFQLKNLARLKTIVAGYVDRPRSNLVVRMLELCVSAENDSNKSKHPRIFSGLRDYDLFIGKIKPGERSAIFGIVSSSTEHFTDELALHFFYINIGSPDHPYLARVEMPAWVVDDKEKVDLLHGCLINQCQQMGDKAYPYVLHRAHEVAVLSHAEKNHLQGLIIAEMLARGIDIKGSSHKQFAKDNSGKRMRYK